MSADPAVLAYQVSQMALQIESTTKWRGDVSTKLAARDVEYTNLSAEVAALREDVRSLRKTLVGLAITIAGSSVIFGLSILAATGKV